jgi:hypothetical protein
MGGAVFKPYQHASILAPDALAVCTSYRFTALTFQAFVGEAVS